MTIRERILKLLNESDVPLQLGKIVKAMPELNPSSVGSVLSKMTHEAELDKCDRGWFIPGKHDPNYRGEAAHTAPEQAPAIAPQLSGGVCEEGPAAPRASPCCSTAVKVDDAVKRTPGVALGRRIKRGHRRV